jgi:hypothetical protein
MRFPVLPVLLFPFFCILPSRLTLPRREDDCLKGEVGKPDLTGYIFGEGDMAGPGGRFGSFCVETIGDWGMGMEGVAELPVARIPSPGETEKAECIP